MILSLGIGTAQAQEQAAPQPTPEAKGLPFAAFLSEDELRLLFDYFRDAMIANMKGEEVGPLPPELSFKLLILREQLLKQGDAMVQQYMQLLRKELERSLKEPPAPPPKPERT